MAEKKTKTVTFRENAGVAQGAFRLYVFGRD